jgi:hypothetical protein
MKALPLVLLLALCGCTTTEVRYKDFVLQRARFGTRESVKEIRVEPTAAGVVFRMVGYSSDQVEALGTVAREAAKGAVEGAK